MRNRGVVNGICGRCVCSKTGGRELERITGDEADMFGHLRDAKLKEKEEEEKKEKEEAEQRKSSRKLKNRPTKEELAEAEAELNEMKLAKTGGRAPERIGDDGADVFGELRKTAEANGAGAGERKSKKLKSRPTKEELDEAERELTEMKLAKTGGRAPERIADGQ